MLGLEFLTRNGDHGRAEVNEGDALAFLQVIIFSVAAGADAAFEDMAVRVLG